MRWWRRGVVAVLMRLNRTFWRDLHEDTCGARFCGGWRCCTCFSTPAYVRQRRANR